MRKVSAALLFAAVALVVAAGRAGDRHIDVAQLSVTPRPMIAVAAAQFCPTSGRVTALDAHTMKVDESELRGVVAGDTGNAAELAFTYRGPSKTTVALADGSVRRQIGLKLRAADTCNVIYVMWHVAPTHEIAVSVKRNVGQSTHAQCADHGYINLPPSGEPIPAALAVGTAHVLAVQLDGLSLRVTADGVVVWHGQLPPEAAQFKGPAGMRSDDGEFDFELRVPGGAPHGASCATVVKD